MAYYLVTARLKTELAPELRELYLFANDWPNRYGNNVALPPQEGGPLRAMLTRSL